MVATSYPMKQTKCPGREPGWPAPNYKEEEPSLGTVAITTQMKRKEWQSWWPPHTP